MKTNYFDPEMDIVMFSVEDVINTSDNINVDDGSGNINLPVIPAD